MNRFKNFVDKYSFWLITILSIPAVWALFVPGFYGASDELHIAWLYEMYETLKIGQFPVRFVPDLSFGFGYPLFNFVFPLPFYVGSLFHFLGFSLVDSIKLVFFVSVPISGFFMYKLLREYVNELLSILGALIYIFTPYRATDIYVRGAIGEIFSFIYYPLIILSFLKVINNSKISFKWVGFGALSIAGLILSHNISSYMFLPFALVFGLLRLANIRFKKISVYSFFLTLVLGLALSSFFWIPAITESGLVKYSTTFDFWDHFPTLKQLITPYFGYGASVPGPYDGMSFFVGYANIAIFLTSFVVLLTRLKKINKNDFGVLAWSFFIIVVSVFFMNYRSMTLWKILPFLPYFQFPWRFLTLITFASSLMVISLKYINWRMIGLLIFILILLSFPNFRPHDFLGREDAYFLSKYVPYPEVQKEYLTQSEEYLRLPQGLLIRPDKLYPVLVADNETSFNIQEDKRLGVLADAKTAKDVVISYNKYNFPGWVAKVDGKVVKTFSGYPFSQVSFNLSSGKHRIDIYFQETNFRRSMNLISFLGLITIAGFLVKKEK